MLFCFAAGLSQMFICFLWETNLNEWLLFRSLFSYLSFSRFCILIAMCLYTDYCRLWFRKHDNLWRTIRLPMLRVVFLCNYSTYQLLTITSIQWYEYNDQRAKKVKTQHSFTDSIRIPLEVRDFGTWLLERNGHYCWGWKRGVFRACLASSLVWH